jgi:integrase
VATVQNRSRFRVTVRHHPSLTREFSYNRLAEVKVYMAELRERGLKPRVDQLADHFEVRIRQRGYPPLSITCASEVEAEAFVRKVEEEHSRGLFVDYTKAHNVTLAELLVRFLLDESSRRRSCELERYKMEGWLADSGPAGERLLVRYRDELRRRNQPVRPAKFQMRDSATHIAWIHKRLTAVTTEDIDIFMRDRLEDVAPGTVDRELDILSSVFNVVTKVWGYRLQENPMTGVRRPRYFNERDRRLVGDEEQRLLAAARAEDHARCAEAHLQRLVDSAVEGLSFTSVSARKKVRAARSAELRAHAATTCRVVPLMEAFVQFQLMAGPRRGETLDLTWARLDFDAQTAFIPLTKNGRPRKLSLRSDLLDLLERLPRTDGRVFPIGVDALAAAWKRICVTAGVEDLHIHDLRHEAISRVAELGDGTPGSGFGLVELQAFSGHRDTRMLLRYAHLCASRMARRLDEAFAKAPVHKGRRRLGGGSEVKVANLTAETLVDTATGTRKAADAPVESTAPLGSPSPTDTLRQNVITLPLRR